MRRIRFRGKWIASNYHAAYNGKWVYGSLITVNNQPYINYAGCTVEIRDGYIVTSAVEVDANTVGQNTTLKDKNGHYIFEGDIVMCKGESIFEVRWFGDGFAMRSRTYGIASIKSFLPTEMEVIGNIHDNPELIQHEP